MSDLQFIVRLGRGGSPVQFDDDAAHSAFGITNNPDQATPFDSPVAAQQAIDTHPAIKEFHPVIERSEGHALIC